LFLLPGAELLKLRGADSYHKVEIKTKVFRVALGDIAFVVMPCSFGLASLDSDQVSNAQRRNEIKVRQETNGYHGVLRKTQKKISRTNHAQRYFEGIMIRRCGLPVMALLVNPTKPYKIKGNVSIMSGFSLNAAIG